MTQTAASEITVQQLPVTPWVQGAQTPATALDDLAMMKFAIRQSLTRASSAVAVKVLSVTNSGGVSPIGSVSVTPLVNMLDGSGNAIQHGEIFNIPYCRIQGGTNALIMDPVVGDMGLMVTCDRDISKVKATFDRANPGSFRIHDMADGIFVAVCISTVTPTQFIQFNADGITITSPTKITLKAPIVEVDAPSILLNGTVSQGHGSNGGTMTMEGPVTVNNDLTANGTSVHGHVHTHTQSGNGLSGVPQ
jgi:hypothetical protein